MAQSTAAPRRLPKPVRVLIGVTIMALLVGTGLWLLARQAGAWGVPYFSFTTDNGSTCTNQWAGYVCEDLTTADLEGYGQFELPADTEVVSSTYTRTHDYSLSATLRTSADAGPAAVEQWVATFGQCAPGGVPPVEMADYEQLCVINSDINRGTQDVPVNRRWLVSTGIAPDGSRLTMLTVSSR